METKQTGLIPYLHFEGNCEEALNYYAGILGGTVEIRSRYDNPAMNAPEAYREKVLHGRLHFSGLSIYTSDVFPGQKAQGSSGDVALSLTFPDEQTAQQVFDQLAKGGKTRRTFRKTVLGRMAW
ncbi:VOC family protein [Chitinophaga sp. XS-30]|uniref:VOC family protein n=1 Tax=Chitinophaga sp. XS-30 TaxID=2604421 RepID=UPI0011DE0DBA|nr:VOC family protein [Chitinophaga sp. XS-30]QEH42779.1 hypothetical protein FW415_18645 [Chitinophaga sp. XS-30]